jgi:hypothetical protein
VYFSGAASSAGGVIGWEPAGADGLEVEPLLTTVVSPGVLVRVVPDAGGGSIEPVPELVGAGGPTTLSESGPVATTGAGVAIGRAGVTGGVVVELGPVASVLDGVAAGGRIGVVRGCGVAR